MVHVNVAMSFPMYTARGGQKISISDLLLGRRISVSTLFAHNTTRSHQQVNLAEILQGRAEYLLSIKVDRF